MLTQQKRFWKGRKPQVVSSFIFKDKFFLKIKILICKWLFKTWSIFLMHKKHFLQFFNVEQNNTSLMKIYLVVWRKKYFLFVLFTGSSSVYLWLKRSIWSSKHLITDQTHRLREKREKREKKRIFVLSFFQKKTSNGPKRVEGVKGRQSLQRPMNHFFSLFLSFTLSSLFLSFFLFLFLSFTLSSLFHAFFLFNFSLSFSVSLFQPSSLIFFSFICKVSFLFPFQLIFLCFSFSPLQLQRHRNMHSLSFFLSFCSPFALSFCFLCRSVLILF